MRTRAEIELHPNNFWAAVRAVAAEAQSAAFGRLNDIHMPAVDHAAKVFARLALCSVIVSLPGPLRPEYSMLRKFLLSVVAFVCVGCGAVNKHRPPTTESDCAAAGGTWTPIEALPATRYCDLKTADAGKWCVDSMQCEGSCQASEKAQVGSFASGQCADHTQDYGTVKLVNMGRVTKPDPVL